MPKNNFKLVSGSGFVTAIDTLEDELFEKKFKGALRVYRKVEYARTVKEIQLVEDPNSFEIGGDDYKEEEVEVKRWFKVERQGQPLELDLVIAQQNQDDDTDRPKPTYAAPFASTSIAAKRALLAG